ncbi:MAG: hypothetical protein R3228_19460, partial [Halioglobus sp.]|nr:hypothetical protein [Halioglobus sp.]
MQLIIRLLAVVLCAAMFSTGAQALVADGKMITGLPKDTTVVIDLGGGVTTEANTGPDGTLTPTEEEDDRKAGFFFWPAGKDGSATITNQATGENLGDFQIIGGKVSIAALVAPGPGSMDGSDRFYVYGGYSNLSLSVVDGNTGVGAGQAAMEGFTVDIDTEDDTNGYHFGAGYSHLMCGDRDRQGAWTLDTELSLADFNNMPGEFNAAGGPELIRSKGVQDASSLGLSVGTSYTFVDNWSAFVFVGGKWYKLEDSGAITGTESGTVFNEFSETTTDFTATIAAGLQWNCDESWFARMGFEQGLQSIGEGESDEPAVWKVSLG